MFAPITMPYEKENKQIEIYNRNYEHLGLIIKIRKYTQTKTFIISVCFVPCMHSNSTTKTLTENNNNSLEIMHFRFLFSMMSMQLLDIIFDKNIPI